jgi:hypothetical protein
MALKKVMQANQIIHRTFYEFPMHSSVASYATQGEIQNIIQEAYEPETTALRAVGVHCDPGRSHVVRQHRLRRAVAGRAPGRDAPR